MAYYNICGRACNFYKIPHGILTQYQPTPRTFIVAWKTPKDPLCNILLGAILQCAYIIEAMERPPFCVEDGERSVYLIEHPNTQVLETWQQWAHWTCGAAVLYTNPYRVAKGEAVQQMDKALDDLLYTRTANGKRLLLGNAPLSKHLPPFPNHCDYEEPKPKPPCTSNLS